MNDQTPQTPDDQFPALVGYLDDTALRDLITNHTTYELERLENAFNLIESGMTEIHRHAEIESKAALLEAILAIWDNSRDLAFDDD